MGVKGLWRLLLPIGRRISIETLEGQILAIDASIWLTQFLTVAARQREQELLGDGSFSGNNTNRSGKAYSYDYLVGFLRRLCKLRYQGVRPVLVFDGETPEIKKREIRERNKRRKRKLGESFYLGDKNKNHNAGDVSTQEEDEFLEATRRMAKRILAKQLKSGKLVTTRNKKLKAMKGSAPTNIAKGKSKTTIASASYAPGFYDPDAAKVVATSDTQKEQQGSESMPEESNNDDHLLRDDYNTNPLKEEINDWDKPIVIDSDNENEQNSKANVPKKPIAKFLKHTSKFHAGDGTKFKVESVADLPESARKDVIEDARKQRRLASRREFMGVAYDPDGLSSCQLRNFLKSTKLNQDITAMAQQAKKKAEEEAKMTLGNGILFEKYNEDDKGRSYLGTNRRQHYLSKNNSRKGRKNANLGMMRMFHHKDQVKTKNSANQKTNKNDSDDEHDFRKTRNNHYLSGGIRFVNRDEKNQNDDFIDECLDEEKDRSRSHYESKMADDDGGFAIAITDGSDQPKKQNCESDPVNKVNDDVIEIDVSSESDSDHSDDDDDRKPAARRKQEIKSSKSSQERQDEELARALQNIEEEEMNIDETNEEYIEIDDNEDGDGGGFFRNALPSPSREENDSQMQQERDDARFARALQEAEYEEEEGSDGGGGFLVEARDGDNDETMDGGGGFLVGAKADSMQKEDDKENGGGFLASEKGDNFEEENEDVDGGFFLPSDENGNSREIHFRDDGGVSIPLKRDIEVRSSEKSFEGGGQNPFAPSHANATNSIFDMMKQRKIQNNQTKLLVCPETSEEEEEDEIDWEDGNKKTVEQKEDPNAEKKLIESVHNKKSPDVQEKQTTSTTYIKDTQTNNCDELDNDDDDDDIDWEDGAKSIERKPAANDISVAKHGTKPTKTTKMQEIEKDIENVDDEIDWEEGNNNTENDAKAADEEPTKSFRESETNLDDAENTEIMCTNDDEDSVEVDWEDGNDEKNQSKSEVINLCDEKRSDFEQIASNNDMSTDGEDDEVDWEDGEDEKERSKSEVIDLCEERKMVNSPLNSTSNESRTGGNDGNLVKLKSSIRNTEEASDSKRNTTETSKSFSLSVSPSSKPKTIDIDDDSDDENDIEWEAGEEGGKNINIEPNDWGVTKSHSSNEVAAALEHAQGTAANLTNWAGRAFRRAIAQHAMENGMEVPESAKPSALKNTRNETDGDEPILDETKNNANSPQRISQTNVHSRKQEKRTGGEKIDNSSWLETIDTANTYAEDYTVAPQEANASDRLLDVTAGGVTDEMRTEVMQLLRLFGIPYVVAPAEAEAQCVELERLGLVDGIVTEDSDTFVFGGQVVYKNIFDDKKYVEVYHTKDASEEMNLTQDSLVALAMLLGGDYTEGVKGVGIVNGMEVLQAFDVAQDCEAGLKRFRKWLDGFDPNDLGKTDSSENDNTARSQEEQVFHRKHHTARTRWIAPKHFPDPKVLNAYLNPVVDTSTERFSWGIPDLDGLIAFCHGHMGWVAEETEKLIVPIIKQMEEGSMRQTRIDSFMRYEDGIKFAKIQSKRLRHVLGLSSNTEENPRRKRIHAKAASTSGNDGQEGESNRFSEAEEEDDDSYGEVDDEMFAAMDAYSSSNVDVANQANGNNTQPRKKMYNGKRTRSLAALSSASASTVAIASSSKSDDILPASGDGSTAAAMCQQQRKNLPKKAPPSYQKQSSMILEEQEKESAAQSAMSDDKSNKTYEVINPSVI